MDKQKRLALLEKYIKSNGYDGKSGLTWSSAIEEMSDCTFSAARIAKRDFRDLMELKGITL